MTTHLHQAIRDAIEGGYEDREAKAGFARTPQREAQILLDPDFWRCLGKSRGWDEESNLKYFNRRLGTGFSIWDKRWKIEWHSFIDHLAEGKDIESFFASLKEI